MTAEVPVVFDEVDYRGLADHRVIDEIVPRPIDNTFDSDRDRPSDRVTTASSRCFLKPQMGEPIGYQKNWPGTPLVVTLLAEDVAAGLKGLPFQPPMEEFPAIVRP
jgi:hypothetical protein